MIDYKTAVSHYSVWAEQNNVVFQQPSELLSEYCSAGGFWFLVNTEGTLAQVDNYGEIIDMTKEGLEKWQAENEAEDRSFDKAVEAYKQWAEKRCCRVFEPEQVYCERRWFLRDEEKNPIAVVSEFGRIVECFRR